LFIVFLDFSDNPPCGVIWELTIICLCCDLQEFSRTVSEEEGKSFARRMSTLFVESSAKTNTGVTEAFMDVVEKVRPHFSSLHPSLVRSMTMLLICLY
jgi:hypothetical protein